MKKVKVTRMKPEQLKFIDGLVRAVKDSITPIYYNGKMYCPSLKCGRGNGLGRG
jgi:hypothetical protein